jgi:hypothetical protein
VNWATRWAVLWTKVDPSPLLWRGPVEWYREALLPTRVWALLEQPRTGAADGVERCRAIVPERGCERIF